MRIKTRFSWSFFSKIRKSIGVSHLLQVKSITTPSPSPGKFASPSPGPSGPAKFSKWGTQRESCGLGAWEEDGQKTPSCFEKMGLCYFVFSSSCHNKVFYVSNWGSENRFATNPRRSKKSFQELFSASSFDVLDPGVPAVAKKIFWVQSTPPVVPTTSSFSSLKTRGRPKRRTVRLWTPKLQRCRVFRVSQGWRPPLQGRKMPRWLGSPVRLVGWEMK